MNYLKPRFTPSPLRIGILSIIMLLSIFCSSVIAAPKISGISNAEELGEILTVSGDSFGETAPTFNLQDDAREHTHISDGTVLNGLSQDSLWAIEGSSWATPLATQKHEETGNYFYFGEAKSYNQWIEPLKSKNNKSIYVSWYFNPSESPSSAEGSNKFIRIWDHSSGSNTRISWTQMHMTYLTNDIGYSPSPSWGHWGGKENTWNLMEIWVDSDAGVIEARTNGNVIHEVSDFKKSPIDKGLNVKLLGFDPNEKARYSTLTFMIDDVYISTSRARVVVSESDTWEMARVTGKPQLITSWSNEEISFELQPPLGLETNELYLYVVDDSDEANPQGVPICLKCPRPPSISVQ